MSGETESKKRRDPKKRPVPVIAKKIAPAAGTTERQKPKRKSAEPDGPKYVGGARNAHGTRIAKRITCTRCGLVDHVPYVPRDPQKALCRACAVLVLETYEAGTKVRMPTRPSVCNLCGTPFQIPVVVPDDGDPLCKNCLMGFTTWQGGVDTPFAKRAEVTVEVRLSGTLVRKPKR